MLTTEVDRLALALFIACVASSCGVPGPVAEDPPWQQLFDGATLDGWTIRGGAATYRVEDGAIVGRTVPKTPNTFLCTDREFGDFELEFEFLVDDELNSGVQLRSAWLDGRVRGYQFEIDPSERSWSAGIYEEGGRGWLANLADDPAARAAFRAGEWNRARVVCRGASIRTWLNDVPVAELTDQAARRGFIGLQVHGVGGRTDPLEVRWRRIRIRVTPAAASGESLARPASDPESR